MGQKRYKQDYRLIQPALIIAIGTGVVYLMGYSYYSSLFSRLSLPSASLVLPTAFYLREGIWYCFLFLIFGLPSFIDIKKRPRTFLQALRGNLFVILFGVLGIIYQIITYSKWTNLLVIFLLSIIVLMLVIYFPKHHRSLAYSAYKSGWWTRIMWVTVAFMSSYMLATIFGELSATKLVQGSLGNSMAISLKLKDGTNFQEGKELILIMHHNAEYYVVERRTKVPKYPSLYIIPNSQIAEATIKRIK